MVSSATPLRQGQETIEIPNEEKNTEVMQRAISTSRIVLNNISNFNSASDDKEVFSSASLSLRVQKKLLSRLSNRSVVKQLVNETAAHLFDNFYQLLKVHYSKKEAEKTVKNMIKLTAKLALISRAGVLNENEENLLTTALEKVHSLVLTIISFFKVSYSYERAYLMSLASEVRDVLSSVVDVHLSDKSGKRLEYVFEHICRSDLLDAFFKPNSPVYQISTTIVSDLEHLVDSKDL